MLKPKYIIIVVVFLLLLGGVAAYIIYPRFYSPVYSMEKNEYGMIRLVIGNTIYDEEGYNHAQYEIKAGRQIGRTSDGHFRIFEVKGDKAHDIVILEETGLMPAITGVLLKRKTVNNSPVTVGNDPKPSGQDVISEEEQVRQIDISAEEEQVRQIDISAEEEQVRQIDISAEEDQVRQINISVEEELKWMKFTRDVYSFQSFNRDSVLDEKVLIKDMFSYLFFQYDREDRDHYVVKNGENYVIKQEGLDMLSEEFFGRKVRKHQSVMGIEYKDGYYYSLGFGINGGYRVTHIQDFSDNGDQTYTIDYDYYYVNEGDDSILLRLKPEEFIYEIHKKPHELPSPNAKGKLTLQKIIKEGEERYIIIESLKTDL